MHKGALIAALIMVAVTRAGMNSEQQQPLFHRRRQIPTALINDRLPGYMKPTFGSSQKTLLNRSSTLPLSTSLTSRPQSSPVTLSASLNLQQVCLSSLSDASVTACRRIVR